MSSPKNVVVVGGGMSGVSIASALAAKLNPATHQLVLVSERPFTTHMLAGLRVNVTDDGKFEDRIFIPLERLFQSRKGRFVHARVERIEKDAVHLANGESLPYAALVVATGKTWDGLLNFPKTLESTQESVNAWRERFASVKSVLIVGGGAVGGELAGEIKEFYPNTDVTMLHRQPLLLNRTYPDSFRKKWAKQLESAGVKLVLDDVALDLPNDANEEKQSPVTTKKGKTLEADLVVVATGGRANSSLIAAIDPSAVAANGFIKVRPTLQIDLPNQTNIFALGDVIDWPEQHGAAKLPGHSAVVAANVLSVLAGKEPKKVYKTGVEFIVLARGKSGGLGYMPFLWGLTFPAWMVASIKGKDLLLSLSTGFFKK